MNPFSVQAATGSQLVNGKATKSQIYLEQMKGFICSTLNVISVRTVDLYTLEIFKYTVTGEEVLKT